MGPTRCTPVALGFKRSEWGSKWGPVANNGENIASGRESLGMRPLRPVYGLLGVPPLLWVLKGQNAARSWGSLAYFLYKR